MLTSDSLVIDVMKNFFLSILIAMLTGTCPTGHPYNTNSVVDPNTLNLDPDPGFWLNLDLDPGSS